MKKKIAKYIHILYRNDTKFYGKLVKFFGDSSTGINIQDHVFVTPHKKVYDELHTYCDMVLDVNTFSLVNKYAPLCDWIVCHSFYNIYDPYVIRKKYLKKIIFRFWGGGIGFTYKKNQPLMNIIKIPANKIVYKRFNSMAAIGIAKELDKKVLADKLPDVPFYLMPYVGTTSGEQMRQIRNSVAKNEVPNVALYHRGTVEGNHIAILKKLERFGDRIRIYLTMSYGDKEYIEQVREYVRDNCGDNVIVVDEFMDVIEYCKYINSMDICIFDCPSSTALGNVQKYLYYRKKFVLNRNGIIKDTFDEQGIPCICTDEIDNMTYEEFIAPVEYPEKPDYELLPITKDEAINAWKIILSDFN